MTRGTRIKAARLASLDEEGDARVIPTVVPTAVTSPPPLREHYTSRFTVPNSSGVGKARKDGETRSILSERRVRLPVLPFCTGSNMYIVRIYVCTKRRRDKDHRCHARTSRGARRNDGDGIFTFRRRLLARSTLRRSSCREIIGTGTPTMRTRTKWRYVVADFRVDSHRHSFARATATGGGDDGRRQRTAT